jgi:hypothetical protein
MGQMGLARLRDQSNRRVRLVASSATTVLLAAAVAGCGSDSPKPLTHAPYTVKSIQYGFATIKDIGKGAIRVDDSGHGSHVIYTPPDSVPTCSYVQRADDITVKVQPAVEPVGGNSTGRFIVGPPNPDRSALPVVTQGAVVFTTDALADTGMKTVTAEAAKCPDSFSILGGPPIIVGSYKVNSRAFKSAGWTGFAQQLAHTSPPDLGTDTYDDLATVVAHKSNAIIYLQLAQIRKTGQRADSNEKLEKLLKTTLGRLG